PWLDGQYCGEPEVAACNTCIAERPSHGAADIVSWRRGHAWLFLEADRVFCPSEDARARLERYGLADRAIVAPHEPVDPLPWPMRMPRLAKGQKLRIALIGVLAPQKGAGTVAAVAETAAPNGYDIRLIGYPEQELPEPARTLVRFSGEYKDSELPALLAKINPHVVWFPAQWPETYSYTLSAAIAAGLPIVASAIGAFRERLRGRPHTWLVDPSGPTRGWIDAFEKARAALLARTPKPAPLRDARPNLYATGYVRKPAQNRKGPIDLHRPGRTSVVVIPERFSTGPITPCAYIRLLQPLDHLAAAAKLDIVLADAEEALRYRADLVVTQRYAVQGAEAGEALLKHCREHGIPLLYDLDDDLLAVPRDHPDAAQLRAHVRDVERMLRGADTVWVSTAALRDRIAAVRRDAVIAPNGLDERLWPATPGERSMNSLPVRLLFMGTATHDADFALIEPALARLHDTFGARVSFDMIGVTGRDDLPDWVRRVPPSISGTLSYPGFINWITHQSSWDIGLAPLADTPFNRAKSAIKVLDYAALGLAVAASDVAVYREGLVKNASALLVPNTPAAWYDALTRLVRQPLLRRRLAQAARVAWAGSWTLSAQRESRLALWQQALIARSPQRAAAG
ncbi:MAG: glycosyltransferase, partial [Acetobacteraceae bacterium]